MKCRLCLSGVGPFSRSRKSCKPECACRGRPRPLVGLVFVSTATIGQEMAGQLPLMGKLAASSGLCVGSSLRPPSPPGTVTGGGGVGRSLLRSLTSESSTIMKCESWHVPVRQSGAITLTERAAVNIVLQKVASSISENVVFSLQKATFYSCNKSTMRRFELPRHLIPKWNEKFWPWQQGGLSYPLLPFTQ